jgi:hypothetical protein
MIAGGRGGTADATVLNTVGATRAGSNPAVRTEGRVIVKRYRFDRNAAWPVSDFGSSFSLARLLWATSGEVRVDIAYFAPNDSVGEHTAGLPQLFCIVAGSGWVTGPENERLPMHMSPGDAVFWRSGEMHSAGTENGMTVLIIQAEALDPDSTLGIV